MLRRITILVVCFCLFWEQSGFGQAALPPLIPAYVRGVLPADHFRPAQLRYLGFDPANSSFTVFIDKGDDPLDQDRLRKEGERFLSYVHIGLRLPNSSFWVNLRPDEPSNVIDPLLEQTDIGRILLEADLQLKKDTARLTSPDCPEGRQYWDKLYDRATQLFAGEQDIEIPTTVRPWIVPGEIVLGETGDGAYIYKAVLQVCLEQDWVDVPAQPAAQDPRLKALNEYAAQLMRELILPALTRKINASRAYASLRQAYYALVLAQWFKEHAAGDARWRIDSRDLAGLKLPAPVETRKYFEAYRTSFSQGEYRKQETIVQGNDLFVRSYVCGGAQMKITKAIDRIFDSQAMKMIREEQGTITLPSFSLDRDQTKDGGMPSTGLLAEIEELSPDEQERVLAQYREFFSYQSVSGLLETLGYDYGLFVPGAQEAIRLFMLKELFAGGRPAGSAQSMREFLLNSRAFPAFLSELKQQEEAHKALAPVGTEVEIDTPGYNEILARKLAAAVGANEGKIEGYERREDGLRMEFAPRATCSAYGQTQILDSLIALGLVPEGSFSLHVSCCLPASMKKFVIERLPDEEAGLRESLMFAASTVGFAEVLVNPDQDRIERFTRHFKTMEVRPALKDYARLEYRIGQLRAGEDAAFMSHADLIAFLQAAHTAMVFSLSGSGGDFHADMAQRYGELKTGIEAWAVRQPGGLLDSRNVYDLFTRTEPGHPFTRMNIDSGERQELIALLRENTEDIQELAASHPSAEAFFDLRGAEQAVSGQGGSITGKVRGLFKRAQKFDREMTDRGSYNFSAALATVGEGALTLAAKAALQLQQRRDREYRQAGRAAAKELMARLFREHKGERNFLGALVVDEDGSVEERMVKGDSLRFNHGYMVIRFEDGPDRSREIVYREAGMSEYDDNGDVVEDEFYRDVRRGDETAPYTVELLFKGASKLTDAVGDISEEDAARLNRTPDSRSTVGRFLELLDDEEETGFLKRPGMTRSGEEMSLSDEVKRSLAAAVALKEPVRLNTLEGLSDMADSWEARIVSVSFADIDAPAFFLRTPEQGLIIAVNEAFFFDSEGNELDAAVKDRMIAEALFHEAREAYWGGEHALASAEQVTVFGKNGLSALHRFQIDNLDSEQLLSLAEEYEGGRLEQRRAMERAQSSMRAAPLFDMAAVAAYEARFIRAVRERIEEIEAAGELARSMPDDLSAAQREELLGGLEARNQAAFELIGLKQQVSSRQIETRKIEYLTAQLRAFQTVFLQHKSVADMLEAYDHAVAARGIPAALVLSGRPASGKTEFVEKTLKRTAGGVIRSFSRDRHADVDAYLRSCRDEHLIADLDTDMFKRILMEEMLDGEALRELEQLYHDWLRGARMQEAQEKLSPAVEKNYMRRQYLRHGGEEGDFERLYAAWTSGPRPYSAMSAQELLGELQRDPALRELFAALSPYYNQRWTDFFENEEVERVFLAATARFHNAIIESILNGQPFVWQAAGINDVEHAIFSAAKGRLVRFTTVHIQADQAVSVQRALDRDEDGIEKIISGGLNKLGIFDYGWNYYSEEADTLAAREADVVLPPGDISAERAAGITGDFLGLAGVAPDDSQTSGKGGIDLRSLSPAFRAPAGRIPDHAAWQLLAERSSMRDLDREWQSIQQRIADEDIPCERLKEYIAVCAARQDSRRSQAAVSCIYAMLQWEEAAALPTAQALRELLVFVESM